MRHFFGITTFKSFKGASIIFHRKVQIGVGRSRSWSHMGFPNLLVEIMDAPQHDFKTCHILVLPESTKNIVLLPLLLNGILV